MAIVFGLLHGFGFASVLKSIGLPQTDLFFGLLFFNLGVEIGQVLFLLFIALISATFTRTLLSSEKQSILIDYIAGASSAYWVIDRVTSFSSV